MANVAALGCIICKSEAEVHHIRDGTGMAMRASHQETIPLCFRHHRGEQGIHTLGTRKWEGVYGKQRDLLREVLMQLSRGCPYQA